MSNRYHFTMTLTNTYETETLEEAIEQMQDYIASGDWELQYENENTGETGSFLTT